MIQRITLFLVCMLFIGCSLDQKNSEEISGDNVINTLSKANSLLAQAYSDLPVDPGNFTVLTTDLQPGYLINYNTSTQMLYNWNTQQLQQHTTAIWEAYYKSIVHLNALLASATNFSTENKEWQYIKGNALVLKAAIYFDLLQLYSERFSPKKPGIIAKDHLTNENKARLTQEESLKVIHDLLQEGMPLLATNSSQKKYFITSKGAELLELQLTLFEQDYTKAIPLAEKLIATSNPLPNTIATYSNLWKNNSSSVYWYHNYQKRPNFYLYYENSIFNFATTDIRATITQYPYEMKEATSAKNVKQFLGKYKQVHTDQEDKDLIMARNTEPYFILAECFIKQNQLEKALATLNTFLVSVGEPTLGNTYDQKSLLLILQHQKQKEFLGEKINYFDAKRWEIPVQRLLPESNKLLTTISEEDYRWTWPLPLSEIRQNEVAAQNPGWVTFE